jgi:hypothetical protein
MEDDETPTNRSRKDDYEVGYGKPPKYTRFKPGQSGNPQGRSKGTKNLKTDLMEELMEKIDIREGDRSQRVSKQRALLKSMVNRGIKGDARATNTALSMMLRLLDTGEGAPDFEETLLEGEHEILEAFKDRVRRSVDNQTTAEVDHEDHQEDAP